MSLWVTLVEWWHELVQFVDLATHAIVLERYKDLLLFCDVSAPICFNPIGI